MNTRGISQASWYADFRRIMTQELSASQQKMFKRKNSRVSRAHRMEESIIAGTPSAQQLRSAMLAMAQVARDTRLPNIREQAILIYDECWQMLRKLDLGLPTEE